MTPCRFTCFFSLLVQVIGLSQSNVDLLSFGPPLRSKLYRNTDWHTIISTRGNAFENFVWKHQKFCSDVNVLSSGLLCTKMTLFYGYRNTDLNIETVWRPVLIRPCLFLVNRRPGFIQLQLDTAAELRWIGSVATITGINFVVGGMFILAGTHEGIASVHIMSKSAGKQVWHRAWFLFWYVVKHALIYVSKIESTLQAVKSGLAKETTTADTDTTFCPLWYAFTEMSQL